MNQYLDQFINETFSKPGKALDLGAGKGYDVACLKHLGWKCDGVDIKTGCDLEKKHVFHKDYYDLVFSNYVLHKLKNRENILETSYANLKKGGWLFIHAMDITDKGAKAGIDKKRVIAFLKKIGFFNIKARVFNYYDNEPGHKHWHKIIEVKAQK